MLPATNLFPKTYSPVDISPDVEDHRVSPASNVKDLLEDAPANNVGGGAIPGTGNGPNGEAVVRKKAANKYKDANEKGLPTTSLLRRKVLTEDMTRPFKVGVVGYSEGKFDTEKAQMFLQQGMDVIRRRSGAHPIDIVSGLTNQGIPKLAYNYARVHNYHTTGVACAKASTMNCYPVHTKIIVGNNWGDESDTFLSYIDALIRIGGGDQSLAEVQKFRLQNPTAQIAEFELPRE